MAKENDYIVNKEVSVLLANGEKIVVGHIRSRDGKIMYFNGIRGVGEQWLDQLPDASTESNESVKLQFA